MRIEPERSITRAMSRGRWTAWAVAERFGRKFVPKILLKTAGELLVVTVAVTAVVGEPLRAGYLAENDCVVWL